MVPAVKLALLMFAAIGFAGMGAAWAVARAHEVEDGAADLGMRGLAVVLACFSAACTVAVAGLIGVLAFGAVIGWFSYVSCAQRLGVFRIELFTPRPSAHAKR